MPLLEGLQSQIHPKTGSSRASFGPFYPGIVSHPRLGQKPRFKTRFLAGSSSKPRFENAVLSPNADWTRFQPVFLRKTGPILPLHGVLQNSVLPAQLRCSEAGPSPTTARSSAELRAACPALLQQSWAQFTSSARFCRNGHFLPSFAAAKLGPVRPLHGVSAETPCLAFCPEALVAARDAPGF